MEILSQNLYTLRKQRKRKRADTNVPPNRVVYR